MMAIINKAKADVVEGGVRFQPYQAAELDFGFRVKDAKEALISLLDWKKSAEARHVSGVPCMEAQRGHGGNL